ncbi:uncharacterized protein [Hetaerina americana]|uniref:uncharacterized protein n=1 Tax=Hetaerina americana TaxID=62018 RepID=UPI003A7F5933
MQANSRSENGSLSSRIENSRNSKLLGPLENASTISTNTESKSSNPFIWLKVIELVFAAAVLDLHSDAWVLILLGKNGHGDDIHAAMTPFIATVAFLIFVPVCVLGHFLRRKTPVVTMLTMDVIGLALFATTSIICFVHWDQVRKILMSITSDGMLDDPPVTFTALEKALQKINSSDVRLANDKLLMEGIVSAVMTAMFVGDVFLTIKYAIISRKRRKTSLLVHFFPSHIPT